MQHVHKVNRIESQGSPTNPSLTGDKLSSCQIQCCSCESGAVSLPQYLITCSKHKHGGQTHLNVTGPVLATRFNDRCTCVPGRPCLHQVLNWDNLVAALAAGGVPLCDYQRSLAVGICPGRQCHSCYEQTCRRVTSPLRK
jgi:hypothetical protein